MQRGPSCLLVSDMVKGLIGAALFGVAIYAVASICCYFGWHL